VERMRDDADSDWPDRLLAAIGRVPTVDEHHPRIAQNFPQPFRVELTEMELLLLKCMSRGMTRQMAADTAGIGFQTALTHLKGARHRLRAKSTSHACCNAIRLGLIP
jgi:DNA-binding CsgD family transcriptional regulator